METQFDYPSEDSQDTDLELGTSAFTGALMDSSDEENVFEYDAETPTGRPGSRSSGSSTLVKGSVNTIHKSPKESGYVLYASMTSGSPINGRSRDRKNKKHRKSSSERIKYFYPKEEISCECQCIL